MVAICSVLILFPRLLAGEDQLTFFIYFASMFAEYPLSETCRNTTGIFDVPVKSNLGVDLIDVLAARSLTTRKSKFDFVTGNRY